ncbi:hypothetical protein [Sphingomonas sp.]|jgi:hypothetical protein|uniref:hypothetical protein n=1 Tax=Sphingomonas sp. TaxID=28214 RepID=UPI0035C79A11
MRDKIFGMMATLAIMFNALYVLANIFLSPNGVQYPLINFVSWGSLILAAFFYGPALVAVSIWATGNRGKTNAQD